MSFAAIIRELIAAGVTGDALCDAVARIEAAQKPARSSGAERTARYRARKTEQVEASHVTSRDACDAQKAPPSLSPFVPPHTPPYNPPNPPPEKNTLSARETDFRSAIASEYTRAGFLPPDTGRAVIWLQNGWQESICVEAVRSGLAKKRKQLPLAYFEGQIADAHAPVPIGIPNQRAGPAPKVTAEMLLRQSLGIGEFANGGGNSFEPDRTSGPVIEGVGYSSFGGSQRA
jgi:hypothetical protein